MDRSVDPTSARTAARKADRRRLLLRYALGVVVVGILVVAIGPRRSGGPPLDPRSTGPLGTKGLVEVLERLDTDVRVAEDGPTEQDGVVLVITDGLSESQRDRVNEWVEVGGRLVLADPLSDLAPELLGVASIAFTEPSIQPACDDPLVAGVDRVAVEGSVVFDLPPGATGCFPRNDGFWMVRAPQGRGEVISLGGPLTLDNQNLGQEDTAVLLVNLLRTDGQQTLVLTPDGAAAEGESLTSLLPDQVGWALLQLPLAWLALVWWRGRRHGKPVQETSPVRVQASETTLAVGNLLYRAGRSRDAAAIIRSQVHRELTRRLGIPDVLDVQTFIGVATSRTDLDAQVLQMLLVDPLPMTDDGLTVFANTASRTIGAIRQRRTADPNEGSTASVGGTR